MSIFTRHKNISILTALAVLLLNILFPLVVYAASAVDVTITWLPGGYWEPMAFTVTWITDTDVKLEWVTPAEALATHVRMKVGSAPENVTDGYPVYTGAGTEIHDKSSNLDEMAGIVYYSAWSVFAGDVYSDEHAEGSVQGAGMQAIAATFAFFGVLAFVALLNILAFREHDIFLYTLITPVNITWGLYYASTSTLRHEVIMGIVVVIIGVFCLVRAVMMGLNLARDKRRGDY